MVGRDVVVARVHVADLLGAQSGRHGAAPYTRAPCAASAHGPGTRAAADPLCEPVPLYVQRDQPEGVPPLALTGERTLPDVPEENYWFRRHLVVYEWIAARVRGLRVIDMACGEGYGSDVLAATAASVVGVDANPEAHEHARLRYRRANLRFERELVETFSEPADAVVFLQTIEHLAGPRRGARALPLARARRTPRPGSGRRVRVDARTCSRSRRKGASRSDNPWHVHEYRAERVRASCAGAFRGGARCTGCSTRASCARTSSRCGSAGIAVHPRLGLTAASTTGSRPRSPPRTSCCAPAGEADLERALDFLAVCRS